ncbi:chromosomal replication initiator protein DnaA [bacterium]|nr:chromosomal replication initiator protein DnaA [bacterium]
MPEETKPQAEQKHQTNLLQYYKFENYIAGDNNNFALAFARGVCESPGVEYNPLFIYSGVGLGKTHLLNAIGNEVLRKNPDARILYTSSQQFEAELVDAIQFNKYESFQKHYLQLDMLIMDDIQFLAAREAAQHEFFNAFNTLFNKGKQIVISSDRPPATLSTLEQRIRSRFEGGIISEILAPGLETRKAILCQKLTEKKAAVSDEVVDYICENITDDIRKLEGAIKETLAFAKLVQRPVNKEIAEQVIKQKLSKTFNEPYKEPSYRPQIRSESPQDSVSDQGKKNQMKINISLPPQRKQSLIKESTKNISLDSSSEQKKVPVEKPVTANLEEGVPEIKPLEPASSKPNEVNVPVIQENIENDDEKINISVTDAFATQDISNKSVLNLSPEELDKLSLTEAFSSQTINSHVKIDLNQNTSIPKPPAEKIESKHVQAEDIAAIQQDNNLSLTNIFSSQDVKEKINKIIAVGETVETDDCTPEEKKKKEETSYLEAKNIFRREHKKKLQYELKHYDAIAKKLARSNLDTVSPEKIAQFSETLQLAHAAYADKNYQSGLDYIKVVKDSYNALFPAGSHRVLDTFDIGSSLDGKNIVLFGGMAVVLVLIVLIMWYLIFVL